MIATFGILVDCTVNVTVQLGDGPILYNGGYDVVYNCTVDQNIVYI